MIGARAEELIVIVGNSNVTTSRASNLEQRIVVACKTALVGTLDTSSDERPQIQISGLLFVV